MNQSVKEVWLDHLGGPNPAPGQWVAYHRRDGAHADPWVGRADILRWDHRGWDTDIVRYHVIAAAEPVDAPSVAWACLNCNSPRAVDPCPKCGTSLTEPAQGWEWPETPDVERIRALAREVGYAIGVHGTQERDLDLIAVPWVASAVSPLELARHIATGLGGDVLDYENQDKPCGRWSCNINADGWFKLIDLSVMPPQRGDQ